jgi:DNA helicase-2/ATP-dependent DNA helicase PcrA
MDDVDWKTVPESELPPHLIRLNPQQFDAVAHRSGPLLILAGAGSGKTRVLTRRIAHLLHTGVEPENIFAVTFTNKAASEMKERVTELVGEIGRKVWVSTFHASCCRILRMEAEHLGYTQRFAIYDDDDQIRIMRQIVRDLGYDPKIVVPQAICGKIDHYKNRMLGVDDLVRTRRAALGDPLLRIWREYEEALLAADAMDFNDLIGNAVKLFSEHPDVLQKYRETFHYVMVDEYQDTNKTQYLLLRMLTEGHRNLAVVGDDDQSIYGFRGADISNILNFETDFPDATIVRMEQNYRCTANILALANAVVAKNENRIEKKLWTQTEGGALVSFLVADDPRTEAATVATAIKHLRRQGITWDDMCVIYRTNATSQPFEAAFRDANIPHKVVGGRKFYSRREIRDALAYVRLLVNPNDDAAFLRVVNVPTRGIGTKTLAKVREQAADRGEPLLKTAKAMGGGADRASRALKSFSKLIAELTERAQTASLPALVHGVLQASGYADMLKEEDTHDSRARLDNLHQLLRDAAAFEPEDDNQPPHEQLHAWLDQISLSGSDEEIPEDGEVTLMTVHNSKGLEYPVVFVAQMVEGRFPHSRAAEEPGGVDEERRLAYVAFTRAQKRLIVSRARHELKIDKEKGGKPELNPIAPSRFLFGIPLEVCTGDLPGTEEGGPEPMRLPEPRYAKRLAEIKRRHLQRLREQHGQRPPAKEAPPEEEHVVMDIESLEQLTPGTRVYHDVFGAGTVERVSGPSILVRFGHRTWKLGHGDSRLHLRRD